MLLVHLFVCFVRVSFSQFSFPLGVGGWLQFVIVALLSNYIYILTGTQMSLLHVTALTQYQWLSNSED